VLTAPENQADTRCARGQARPVFDRTSNISYGTARNCSCLGVGIHSVNEVSSRARISSWSN
jgi:hypothetical protein